jgi:hypothetical protein
METAYYAQKAIMYLGGHSSVPPQLAELGSGGTPGASGAGWQNLPESVVAGVTEGNGGAETASSSQNLQRFRAITKAKATDMPKIGADHSGQLGTRRI